MESKKCTASVEIWLASCGSVLPLAGGLAETPNAHLQANCVMCKSLQGQSGILAQ